MKVAVLYGEVAPDAGPDEQDALIQADVVCRSLEKLGHEPIQVPLSADLSRCIGRLNDLRPDFAFNLVESVMGKGCLIHLAPSILDALKIPYTGSGTEAIFLTSHKLLAKKLLRSSGLATPPWFAAEAGGSGFIFSPNLYVVKSVWEHASIGLDEDSVVSAESEDELKRFLAAGKKGPGGDRFAEVFVAGREFNLSLLAGSGGPEVLPPAEIRFDAYPPDKIRIVGYRAKWDEDSFEYHHTPRAFDFSRTDEPLLQELKGLAVACWRLFGLRGYARVDFRVDQAGKPWILEVNTNPCLSPDGGFQAAAKRAGLEVDAVVGRIIKDL